MTSHEPAQNAVQQKIATFYVVPVVPEDGNTETVLYYQDGPDPAHWVPVDPKNLNARDQGADTRAIRLVQRTTETTHKFTGLPFSKLDITVQLYAAVARTLGGSDSLPSAYSLKDGSLVIGVEPNSTRALLLVFTQTERHVAGGTPPYPIVRLIASDPEIKNSTTGNIAA